ncbi:hypothetical protein BC829DRAFT_382531 [Chytridium lagenaria]|nr:hypothetical protein BC829DRAFT_382531 [Chytridium lagenaria]
MEENDEWKEKFSSLKFMTSETCASELVSASERLTQLEDELSLERRQFKKDVDMLESNHSVHVQQVVGSLQKEMSMMIEDSKIRENELIAEIDNLEERRVRECIALESDVLKKEENLLYLRDEARPRRDYIPLKDLQTKVEVTIKLKSALKALETESITVSERYIDTSTELDYHKMWKLNAGSFITKLFGVIDYYRDELDKVKSIAGNFAVLARNGVSLLKQENDNLSEELRKSALKADLEETVDELKKLRQSSVEENANLKKTLTAEKDGLKKTYEAEKAALEAEKAELTKRYEAEKLATRKRNEKEMETLRGMLEEEMEAKVLEASQSAALTKDETSKALEKIKAKYAKELQEKTGAMKLKYEQMESDLEAKEKERERVQWVLDLKVKRLGEAEKAIEFDRSLFHEEQQNLLKKIEGLEERLAKAVQSSATLSQSSFLPSAAESREGMSYSRNYAAESTSATFKKPENYVMAPTPHRKEALVIDKVKDKKAFKPIEDKKALPKASEDKEVKKPQRKRKKVEADGESDEEVEAVKEKPGRAKAPAKKLVEAVSDEDVVKEKSGRMKMPAKKIAVDVNSDKEEPEVVKEKPSRAMAPAKRVVDTVSDEYQPEPVREKVVRAKAPLKKIVDDADSNEDESVKEKPSRGKAKKIVEDKVSDDDDSSSSDVPVQQRSKPPKKAANKPVEPEPEPMMEDPVEDAIVHVVKQKKPVKEVAKKVAPKPKPSPFKAKPSPVKPNPVLPADPNTPSRSRRERRPAVSEWWKLPNKNGEQMQSPKPKDSRDLSDSEIDADNESEKEKEESEEEALIVKRNRPKPASVTNPVIAEAAEVVATAKVTAAMKENPVKPSEPERPAKLPLTDQEQANNENADKPGKKAKSMKPTVMKEVNAAESGDEAAKLKRRLSEKKAMNEVEPQPVKEKPAGITPSFGLSLTFKNVVPLPSAASSVPVGPTAPNPSVLLPTFGAGSRHAHKRLATLLAGASQSSQETPPSASL